MTLAVWPISASNKGIARSALRAVGGGASANAARNCLPSPSLEARNLASNNVKTTREVEFRVR